MSRIKLNTWTVLAVLATLWGLITAFSNGYSGNTAVMAGTLIGMAICVTPFWYIAIRKSQNKKVYWLRVLAIIVVVLLGMLLLMTHTAPATGTYQPAPQAQVTTPPTVDELLRRVNVERQKAGVAALTLSPLLNQSAQYKSQDMLDRNYFTHTDPSTGKNNGLDYALAIGKQCTWISENIVETYDIESAMYSWIHSVPHYKAMIDPRYESTGFGIAGNKVVEHFCDER